MALLYLVQLRLEHLSQEEFRSTLSSKMAITNVFLLFLCKSHVYLTEGLANFEENPLQRSEPTPDRRKFSFDEPRRSESEPGNSFPPIVSTLEQSNMSGVAGNPDDVVREVGKSVIGPIFDAIAKAYHFSAFFRGSIDMVNLGFFCSWWER
jgi:hypothetical protein